MLMGHIPKWRHKLSMDNSIQWRNHQRRLALCLIKTSRHSRHRPNSQAVAPMLFVASPIHPSIIISVVSVARLRIRVVSLAAVWVWVKACPSHVYQHHKQQLEHTRLILTLAKVITIHRTWRMSPPVKGTSKCRHPIQSRQHYRQIVHIHLTHTHDTSHSTSDPQLVRHINALRRSVALMCIMFALTIFYSSLSIALAPNPPYNSNVTPNAATQ